MHDYREYKIGTLAVQVVPCGLKPMTGVDAVMAPCGSGTCIGTVCATASKCGAVSFVYFPVRDLGDPLRNKVLEGLLVQLQALVAGSDLPLNVVISTEAGDREAAERLADRMSAHA